MATSSPTLAAFADPAFQLAIQQSQITVLAAYVRKGAAITRDPRPERKDLWCRSAVKSALGDASLTACIQYISAEEVEINGRLGESEDEMESTFQLARVALHTGVSAEKFLGGATEVYKDFDFVPDFGDSDYDAPRPQKGTLCFCKMDELDQTELFRSKFWTLGESDGWNRLQVYYNPKYDIDYDNLSLAHRAVFDSVNCKELRASIVAADPEMNEEIVIENFRMLRDTEGKYTQYTATVEQSKTIGDLPMDTTTATGQIHQAMVPKKGVDGAVTTTLEQRDVPVTKLSKLCFNSLNGRHRCWYGCGKNGDGVPIITSKHEPDPDGKCSAAANGFGNSHARRPSKAGVGAKAARRERRQEEGKRAAEGEGPSDARGERGWPTGRKPEPGEPVPVAMRSAAAYERMGQMRDGKRARAE